MPQLLLPSPRLAICASLCIALPLAVWECAVSTTTSLTMTSTPSTTFATEQQLPLHMVGFDLPRNIIMPPTRRNIASQSEQRRSARTRLSSLSSSSETNNLSLTSNDDDRQKAFNLAVKRAQASSRTLSIPLAANLKSLFPEFTLNKRQMAFELSVKIAQARSRTLSIPLPANLTSRFPKFTLNNATTYKQRRLINLIRIPKAGSSALSATARALVGCGPDGYACCDRLDSVQETTPACPLVDLSCPPVRGCTDHVPDYTYTTGDLTTDEPTITSIRHPASRAVSAFFYSQPHRPSGGCKTWSCFDQDFIQHPRWRNPMTKMLSGYFPYRNLDKQHIDDTDDIGNIYSVHVAKRRLCNFVWFSISEMPIASSLLLYEVYPFSQLLPNPVAFGLPSRDLQLQQSKHLRKGNPKRTNVNDEYLEFKNGIYQEMNGTTLVEQYNVDDMEVYRFGLELFCERLHESGLIDVAIEAGLSAQHFQPCNASASQSSSSHFNKPKLCAALETEH